MHFDSATRCESTFVVSGSLVRCGLRSSHDGLHMFPRAWWQWDDAQAAPWSDEKRVLFENDVDPRSLTGKWTD